MGFVVKADLGLVPGSRYKNLGLLPLYALVTLSAKYNHLIPSLSIIFTTINTRGRTSAQEFLTNALHMNL